MESRLFFNSPRLGKMTHFGKNYNPICDGDLEIILAQLFSRNSMTINQSLNFVTVVKNS